MPLTPQVLLAYRNRDLLSWASLTLAGLCGGVAGGVALCDVYGLALAAEIAAVFILAYVVLAAGCIYFDCRARAILKAATGFSSLRRYFDAEGGDVE